MAAERSAFLFLNTIRTPSKVGCTSLSPLKLQQKACIEFMARVIFLWLFAARESQSTAKFCHSCLTGDLGASVPPQRQIMRMRISRVVGGGAVVRAYS